MVIAFLHAGHVHGGALSPLALTLYMLLGTAAGLMVIWGDLLIAKLRSIGRAPAFEVVRWTEDGEAWSAEIRCREPAERLNGRAWQVRTAADTVVRATADVDGEGGGSRVALRTTLPAGARVVAVELAEGATGTVAVSLPAPLNAAR
jgi:hypothetical protein